MQHRKKTIVVQHTFNNQLVIADIGFKADTVLIDPDSYLISKKNKTIHLAPASPAFIEPFTVVPNPFTNSLSFILQDTGGKKVLMQLFDSYGRLVLSNTAIAETKNQKYTLNVPASVIAGYYLLRITVDGKSTTRSVMKQ